MDTKIIDLQTARDNEREPFDARIQAAGQLARELRVRKFATQAALDKQRAALKGMETSVSRGNYIAPTRFDVRRHEIAQLEVMLANDTSAVEEAEQASRDLLETKAAIDELIISDFVKDVKETYSEYHVEAWGSGLEIRIVLDERRVSVTINLPRRDYWNKGAISPATVNFSALGSVTPQFARRYARMIQTATEIAELADARNVLAS